MEKRMVELLLELKENYNVCGVKAEFEAEGWHGEAMPASKRLVLQLAWV
ncbi:MAG UNVERIFIED_CONTAM: hypothetical protein LVR29_01710 [Microcystis novacekii LVE1205-3]|jgi:hypothetical protein